MARRANLRFGPQLQEHGSLDLSAIDAPRASLLAKANHLDGPVVELFVPSALNQPIWYMIRSPQNVGNTIQTL
jgi:hypothetical protein